jgi:hypothetical protein
MKESPTPQFARPRFARLKAASLYSGIGRSKLYEFAAANDGLFRKNGKATIVDLAVLDRILDALPVKPPRRRKSKAA